MSAKSNTAGVSRRAGMGFVGALATLMLLGAGVGCNKGGGGPLTVPLAYTPNRADPISGTLSAGDVTVHLAPIEDKRDNKDAIGENREGATPVPVYAGEKTPADFVHEQLEKQLKDFGANLVDAPEAADRVIAIELRKFWAEEAPSYRGEVIIAAEVRDKGGRRLWGKEIVAGQGDNTGRSLSVVNYNETLSDATRRMMGTLLGNPAFMKALTR